MLVAVGESGYAAATVEDALEHAGHSTRLFYRYFESKDDCFVRAYEVETDRLCAAMEDAFGTEQAWADSIGAALEVLTGFVADHPPVAKTILIDVYAASAKAWSSRRSSPPSARG